MTRRESDSISNGRDSSAIPPSQCQSPQQASGGDWRVGQVRVQEGVRKRKQPSSDVMGAVTRAALGGSIGIGSGPQGVDILAYPIARDIINGSADSVSGMEPAPSVWLGDIPQAE